MLGTPTATPPRWMIDRHPDMLADKEGAPANLDHAVITVLVMGYKSECAIIVEQLAKRYGAHPDVAAWQTDNEYGCHDTTIPIAPSHG